MGTRLGMVVVVVVFRRGRLSSSSSFVVVVICRRRLSSSSVDVVIVPREDDAGRQQNGRLGNVSNRGAQEKVQKRQNEVHNPQSGVASVSAQTTQSEGLRR